MKTTKRSDGIGLAVAKWGNSLAVRLPADTVKRLGVAEGDILAGEIAADGRLILTPEGRAPSREAVRRMRDFLRRQKPTKPVIADLRRRARY